MAAAGLCLLPIISRDRGCHTHTVSSTMSSPSLRPDDEILCPHYRQWHRLVTTGTEGTPHAVAMLLFECAKRLYYGWSDRRVESVRDAAGGLTSVTGKSTIAAMISRCSDARERTRKQNEWSSETMTEATSRGYRKNFLNPNGHNAYGVFDRHKQF